MEEDLFKTQADSVKFGEVPTGLDDGASEFGSNRPSLQALHFERGRPSRSCFRNNPAHPGHLLQSLLHVSGAGRRRAAQLPQAPSPTPRRRRVRLCTESVATSLPLIDNQHLLAGGFNFRQDVGAEDDGVVAREGLDQVAGIDGLLRIETGGRLVEDQNIGVMDDGLGEPYALAVTFGQLADKLVLHVGDVAALADLVDAAVQVRARRALSGARRKSRYSPTSISGYSGGVSGR